MLKIKSSVFETKTIQLPEQLNVISHFHDTKLTRSLSVCLYESNSFGRFETKRSHLNILEIQNYHPRTKQLVHMRYLSSNDQLIILNDQFSVCNFRI